jgi:Protein of unknown function (DUF1579)
MTCRAPALVALLVLMAAAPPLYAQEGGPAKPGPEHKKLSYFVGRWNLEGTMQPGPMGSGGTMSGTDSCEWFPGGFHLVCQSDGTGPTGAMHGLSIMGYDPQQQRYTWYGIDNTGFGDGATGQLQGDTWSWISEFTIGEQSMKVRYTVIQQSPDAYTWRMEMQTAGGPWVLGGEGRETRAK